MNKPITLCDRCDIEASCLLNYDGVPCRKNRTVEPTKADQIRAMTDEELADWLVLVEQRIIKVNPMLERPALFADWLDWLRQEAE